MASCLVAAISSSLGYLNAEPRNLIEETLKKPHVRGVSDRSRTAGVRCLLGFQKKNSCFFFELCFSGSGFDCYDFLEGENGYSFRMICE